MKNIQAPPLPSMFSRYRNGLETELRRGIPIIYEGCERGDSPLGLYGMLMYHMGWADEKGGPLSAPGPQGKALRPTLCLFASEALGEDWSRALPAAVALEFIHNFSLIHDDIQDGDTERRHQATVWALWGQPQAMVAGNAMRALADMAIFGLIQRGVPETKALQTSCLLTNGYLEMTRGQCLDLSFECTLSIGLEDYLDMISCKTGALIRCGMEMGATIASDEEGIVRALGRCGGFLGLAFQIRDDMLGIWGDEAATGKAVDSDIHRKKKSFPIVYALEVAREAAREKLVDTYSKEYLDDGDVTDVLTVLEDLKAADYAREMTRKHADLCLDEARRVPLAPWARCEIEELVEFVTARDY